MDVGRCHQWLLKPVSEKLINLNVIKNRNRCYAPSLRCSGRYTLPPLKYSWEKKKVKSHQASSSFIIIARVKTHQTRWKYCILVNLSFKLQGDNNELLKYFSHVLALKSPVIKADFTILTCLGGFLILAIWKKTKPPIKEKGTFKVNCIFKKTTWFVYFSCWHYWDVAVHSEKIIDLWWFPWLLVRLTTTEGGGGWRSKADETPVLPFDTWLPAGVGDWTSYLEPSVHSLQNVRVCSRVPC